ncbi:class I SAM-dependent methyltransferase [Agriterribacter sp.]|uniref:class I SAM-dependent methyltransferase n=1 Tax=Agriterribacter sp. TaxID=2821509 RepID=UPI002B76FB86|nr:class I SAM-dependent methyltransferase [Agriterribacter sp.]HRP57639.1 class I SAM-dependent methyltransferase [Agriterribacter sp.]
MRIDEAAAMLDNEYFHTAQQMAWADLGCGSGTFTMALATLLYPGSVVHAIDNNAAALKQIPPGYNQVSIEKHKIDFVGGVLPFDKVDGILMANALHYVQQKVDFIKKTAGFLKDKGQFLIVEYNTDQPVPVWVPFPVSFASLQNLFHDADFNTIRLLSEHPSVYGHAPMYSAIVKR